MENPWSILKAPCQSDSQSLSLEQRQSDWLVACLKRNQETWFGRKQNFRGIDSVYAYQSNVSLARYENFAGPIDRITQGEPDVLFQGNPIAFEQTGGSSGGCKLIPYSSDSLVDFQCAILPWLSEMVANQGLSDGTIYMTLSPATRQIETTAAGTPIGLPDLAYLGQRAGRALMELSAVPPWVAHIADIEQWRLASLYWLLRRQDLTLISLWSPSFFLQLLQGLSELYEALSALLQHGGAVAGHAMPADHAALDRLTGYLQDQDSRRLWPGLELVSCWMDASSRPYAEELRQRLPQARFQAKGLLATEGVVTVPGKDGSPLLAAGSGFYEFLDEDKTAHCAWELETGKDYEVVMTTSGGLYRYRTGDLVRHEGLSNCLPVLRFLGRNDHTSDLVGEKLTEAFVSRCLADLPGFGFRMLAPVASPQPHYTLILDLGQSVDLSQIEQYLCTNPQYAYARKLGQLGPLTLTTHPDPLQRYTLHAAQRQRLGDVKVPALLPPTMEIELFMEQSR
jgi:hypothetical protein